jgi:hypothetical protein
MEQQDCLNLLLLQEGDLQGHMQLLFLVVVLLFQVGS